MKSLREVLTEAREGRYALGHFNFSTLDGLWAIVHAARAAELPVLVGTSEGERKAVGVAQAVALVRSMREELDWPIFLNADHSHSLESAREALVAGYDMVVIDGAAQPLAQNIDMTKRCVEFARSLDREVLVEGELGYIGTSSEVLEQAPEGAILTPERMTRPEEAVQFASETGIDLLAPAVGNIHGLIRTGNPALNIERIKELSAAVPVPLVLHGGSGTTDQDFRAAIDAGIRMVHINTELRVAFKESLEETLQSHREEVTPYKLLEPGTKRMQEIVEQRLRLFGRCP